MTPAAIQAEQIAIRDAAVEVAVSILGPSVYAVVCFAPGHRRYRHVQLFQFLRLDAEADELAAATGVYVAFLVH